MKLNAGFQELFYPAYALWHIPFSSIQNTMDTHTHTHTETLGLSITLITFQFNSILINPNQLPVR